MKYLGIDFGMKRIGLAVADSETKLAFPLSVIPKEGHIETILSIMKERDIHEVVLGESLDFQNKENPIMKHIEILKNALVKEGVVVHFEKEFLTSQQAKHIQGETKMHDASAAALILQGYIDKHLK